MELNSIEEQCKELQDVVSTLNSKFIELAKKAEDMNEIKYLFEGNAMKVENLKVLKRRKEELLTEKQKLH